MRALKKSKMYEARQASMMGTIHNLEAQRGAIEDVLIAGKVVGAMRNAHDIIQRQQEGM